MATPRKSAFDILMNKTNRQKETPTKKPTLKLDLLDDSVIIIKDDADTSKTINDIQGAEVTATDSDHNIMSTNDVQLLTDFKNIYQHSHQYSEEDQDFLKSLTTCDLDLKSNLKYKSIESDLCSRPQIDYSSSYMNFTIASNKNQSHCGCKYNDDLDECSEDIVFSLNNSLENGGEINDIQAKEVVVEEDVAVKKEPAEGRPKRTLSKKSSSSSLLLKNPNAKRRRTDNTGLKEEVEEGGGGEKSKPKKNGDGDEESVQMWTEKYQFKDENEIVTNKSQLARLREWLNNWRMKYASKASKDGNNNDSKSSGSESGSEYSCSDEDSSDDSASSSAKNRKNGKKSYANAIILAGPHGCGKTSSVYIVAKQLGFKLFEVNASSLRSKSHIIQELEGALDSHHVANRRTANNNLGSKESRTSGSKIDTFFKSTNQQQQQQQQSKATTDNTKRGGQVKRPAQRRSTSTSKLKKKQEDGAAAAIKSVVNVHKESLILFDEIEVVFKEDVGFWSTVNHFVKRSKKPIVITTNDEFVQQRLNLLNVERIEFERPRVDAAIRFLVSVAAREHSKLETSTAYEIVRECGCDMRKALVQLQALIEGSTKTSSSSSSSSSAAASNGLIDKYKAESRNGTLDLDLILSKCAFRSCSCHNHDAYFDRIFYLDGLVRRLMETDSCSASLYSTCFKTYDKFLIKDGLTDNTATNHQLSQNSNAKLNVSIIGGNDSDKVSLSKYKTTSATNKDQLTEYFSTFITLFNENKSIGLSEWLRHGSVNRHNYASSTSIDRLAQSLAKFSSSRELALDYRPHLQCICRLEEAKQQACGRKRFLHYLNQTNIGLLKEDFALLARSSLLEKSPTTTTKENNETQQQDEKKLLLMNRMDSNERLATLFINAQLYDTNN